MKYCIIILTMVLFSCTNGNQKTEVNEGEQTQILLGIVDQIDLEDFSWYKKGYTNYSPSDYTSAMASYVNGLSVDIYFGSWCEDSQRELPAFLKIIRSIDKEIPINLIAVDEDKEQPKELLTGKNISFVPTFIFKKGDREIGRIVEAPEQTLEGDMFRIVRSKQ